MNIRHSTDTPPLPADMRIFDDEDGGQSIEIGQLIGYMPDGWQSADKDELAELLGEEVKKRIKADFLELLSRHEI